MRLLAAHLVGATSINLSQYWTNVWNGLVSDSTLTTFLTIIGGVIVVASVGRWLWERRVGAQGRHMHVVWSGVVGLILMAPDVLIPLILSLTDDVLNGLLKI